MSAVLQWVIQGTLVTPAFCLMHLSAQGALQHSDQWRGVGRASTYAMQHSNQWRQVGRASTYVRPSLIVSLILWQQCDNASFWSPLCLF